MPTVLVTGATGFVATHLILALLEQGYEVRGTARSAEKAGRLNATLSAYAGKPVEIELVSADLTKDAGWAEAVEGVDVIQHVASPFPPGQPRSADELIIPAREGALRVLRAARAAGVGRVVLTSSVAAIDNGWGGDAPESFNESHWTRMDRPAKVGFYAQSKTLAEEAAWEFVQGEGKGLELAVINPVGVLGPLMSADVSTSISLVTRPLKKEMPGYPRLHQGIIDVRDLAEAHIRAMERPAAAGERFIISAGSLWFHEVGQILREAYPDRDIPSRILPSWMIRLLSLFDPALRLIAPNLDRQRNFDTQKAQSVLGMSFRSPKEAVLASAESAIRLGIV